MDHPPMKYSLMGYSLQVINLWGIHNRQAQISQELVPRAQSILQKLITYPLGGLGPNLNPALLFAGADIAGVQWMQSYQPLIMFVGKTYGSSAYEIFTYGLVNCISHRQVQISQELVPRAQWMHSCQPLITSVKIASQCLYELPTVGSDGSSTCEI